MHDGLHFYFRPNKNKKPSLIFKWFQRNRFLLLFDFGVCVCFFLSFCCWKEQSEEQKEEEEKNERTCISCLTLELIGSCSSQAERMSAHTEYIVKIIIIYRESNYIVCIDCLVSPKGKWKHIVHCINEKRRTETINCLKREKIQIKKRSKSTTEWTYKRPNDRILLQSILSISDLEMHIFIRGDHFVDALN